MLAALEMVDAVVVFEQDTPLELIGGAPARRSGEGRRLHGGSIVGAREVRAWGGDVVVIPLTPGTPPPPPSSDCVATESAVRTSRVAPRRRDAAVTLERGVAPYAEGSCLISFGATRVLCTASVEDGVPGWRRGTRRRLAHRRVRDAPARDARRARRASASQIGGRTQEIQRLIGRSIRAMLDDFRVRRIHASSSTATCSSPTAARARRRSPARASRPSTRSTGWSRPGAFRRRRSSGASRR